MARQAVGVGLQVISLILVILLRRTSCGKLVVALVHRPHLRQHPCLARQLVLPVVAVLVIVHGQARALVARTMEAAATVAVAFIA